MHIENIYRNEDFEKLKSQQVYKNDRFHTMLIKIKQDEVLKPHHATTDAFLVVIEGEILFNLNDEDFHLKKGDMFTFKAFEKHSVKALENAIFLVVK